MTAQVNEPERAYIYRTLEVYRHLTDKPILFVCQTPWYFGFHTHWHEDRTVGCPGETICKLCKIGDQKRWSGAIIASRADGTHAKLLLFTQSCVRAFQDANDQDSGLLHLAFKMWRRKPDCRSELQCAFQGVVPNLNTIWTMESLRHHVDRIFKSRTLVKQDKGNGGER